MWPFKRKKKSDNPSRNASDHNEDASQHLRRRFHHMQLAKRKTDRQSSHGSVSMIERRHRPRARSHWEFSQGTKRATAILLASFLLLGGLYAIFFSSFFTIDKVHIEKNGNALSISALEPYLEKIKGNNILFFNGTSLSREIMSNYPNEVLLVKMVKRFPSSITVKIDEYPALANIKVVLPDGVQTFVVNQIGYAFAENVEQKQLPLIIVQTEKKQLVRTIIIPKDNIILITDTISRFKELFGMKVTEAKWLKTERELDLTTEKNFTVWIDLTWDTEKQLMKLKNALPQLNIYKDPLEYIDLRIAGAENEKVFFKRRK